MGHFASYHKSKLSVVPFVPTDIAGCQLWLKADAGVIKDGSNYVSQWTDQSGNNNHAVQTTGYMQPLWVDWVLNGKPILRFDGVNDYLKLPNSCMPVRENTIIIVFRCNKINDCSMLLSSFYGNEALAVDVGFTSIGNLSYFVSGAETLNDYTTSHRFDDNNFYYIIAKYDNSTITYITNDNVTPYITKYKSGDIIYHSQNQAAIGSYLSTGGAYGYNHLGDIAEIIIYHSAISTQDQSKLDQYLTNKYAI